MLSVAVCWWSFADHLLIKAWLLWKSVALWTRPHRTSQTENGRNRKDAARLWGSLPLGYVISFWKRVVSGMDWYLTYVVAPISFTVWLLFCWGASVKGPKGPGDGIFVSYLVTGVIRPCVGRELVSSRDVQTEAIPCGGRKFLSLTICWKSIFQYEPCTVLVVEPAI